jgi:hypothetical protein
VCCTRPGMMVIKRENAGAEGAGDGIFMQADESSSGARLSAIAEDMEVLSGNGQHRRADGPERAARARGPPLDLAPCGEGTSLHRKWQGTFLTSGTRENVPSLGFLGTFQRGENG